MKRIQCTKCQQTFWTELKIDETLILSGEWVQHPCPRCGAEWVVVEPGTRKSGATGKRRAKTGPKRRVSPRQPASTAKETAALFSPARIRSLRKKLGISQKELASLTGVSTGAVVSWEKGKFKPKQDKISQLASLAGKGKDDMRKLLAAKMPEQVENVQAGKPKGKKSTTRKGVSLPKEQKL